MSALHVARVVGLGLGVALPWSLLAQDISLGAEIALMSTLLTLKPISEPIAHKIPRALNVAVWFAVVHLYLLRMSHR